MASIMSSNDSARDEGSSWRGMHGNDRKRRGVSGSQDGSTRGSTRRSHDHSGLDEGYSAARSDKPADHSPLGAPPPPSNTPERSRIPAPGDGRGGPRPERRKNSSRGSSRKRPDSVRPLDMSVLKSALEDESQKVLSPAQKYKASRHHGQEPPLPPRTHKDSKDIEGSGRSKRSGGDGGRQSGGVRHDVERHEVKRGSKARKGKEVEIETSRDGMWENKRGLGIPGLEKVQWKAKSTLTER